MACEKRREVRRGFSQCLFNNSAVLLGSFVS
jgi:hypothetical protein